MKKFAFIGAGSLQFTSSCVRDLLTFPAFRQCEFRLMDTNVDNLKNIEKVVKRIIEEMNCPDCRIISTTDRIEALRDADGVLCTVFNGDVDIWQHEILIPKKYGIDIHIGDTRSVSGIFRALRNIPLLLDICKDIEKYCPDAVFLNYTNPMSMLCGAMQKYSNVEVTGLCHSVQYTIEMLSEKYGRPSMVVEEFQSSYVDDDSRKMYEVGMDRCKYYSIFKTKLGTIELSINKADFGEGMPDACPWRFRSEPV